MKTKTMMVSILGVLLCLLQGGSGLAQDVTEIPDQLTITARTAAAEPYIEIGPTDPQHLFRTLHIDLDAYAAQEPLEIVLCGQGVVKINWNHRAYLLDLPRRGPPKLTAGGPHPLIKPSG